MRDEEARVPESPVTAAGAQSSQLQQPPGVFELPIRSTSSGFWSSAINVEGIEKPLNFIVDTGASI